MDIIFGTVIISVAVIFPALIVAVTVHFTIRKAYENDLKKQVLDLKHNSKQVITPIRLQAYERLALLLERMKPDNVLLRNQGNNLTAVQYRTILLTAIRSEFDHNLSQQVYVSSALWEATKKAKEEMAKIINLAAGKVGSNASGADLATAILELYVGINPLPSDAALELLRCEIKELY
jgi:predicted AlkP superfamily phosphohydrolase/phosphomutase